MANAGKEGEVHVLERETRYMLDSDEAPFIRERIEGKETRAGGRTREGEYGERSLGVVEMIARARKGEHRE